MSHNHEELIIWAISLCYDIIIQQKPRSDSNLSTPPFPLLQLGGDRKNLSARALKNLFQTNLNHCSVSFCFEIVTICFVWRDVRRCRVKRKELQTLDIFANKLFEKGFVVTYLYFTFLTIPKKTKRNTKKTELVLESFYNSSSYCAQIEFYS